MARLYQLQHIITARHASGLLSATHSECFSRDGIVLGHWETHIDRHLQPAVSKPVADVALGRAFHHRVHKTVAAFAMFAL